MNKGLNPLFHMNHLRTVLLKRHAELKRLSRASESMYEKHLIDLEIKQVKIALKTKQ